MRSLSMRASGLLGVPGGSGRLAHSSSRGSISRLKFGGLPSRQSSQGKCAYQPLHSTPAASGASSVSRKRQIADRDHMQPIVARPRVPPTVAERVKLLHIAEVEAGLPLHPVAQADFERAVLERREQAERQRGRRALWTRAPAGHTVRICGSPAIRETMAAFSPISTATAFAAGAPGASMSSSIVAMEGSRG